MDYQARFLVQVEANNLQLKFDAGSLVLISSPYQIRNILSEALRKVASVESVRERDICSSQT